MCCNPPFYSEKKQRKEIQKKNFIAENCEIYYNKGEVGFISDLIDESLEFDAGVIRLYTCFLQKYRSVEKIKLKLEGLKEKNGRGVEVFLMEQPMGRLVRYFLGWRFLNVLHELNLNDCDKPVKKIKEF